MPRDIVEEVEFLLPITAKAPSRPASDKTLRVLEDARQWLSDPAHWCKGMLLMDENGCDAVSRGTKVARSCAWGALGMHADGTRECGVGGSASPAYKLLERLCERRFLQVFNDDPAITHADVLALFDRAISARRSELGIS